MEIVGRIIPTVGLFLDDALNGIQINSEKLKLLNWRLFSPISELQVTSDPLNPNAPKSDFNAAHPLANLPVTTPPLAKLEIYLSDIENHEWTEEEEHEPHILSIENANMNAITIMQFVTEVSRWAVEENLKEELKWTTSYWQEWYVEMFEGPQVPELMPGAKSSHCWGILLHGELWLPEGGWWLYLSDPSRYSPQELVVNM